MQKIAYSTIFYQKMKPDAYIFNQELPVFVILFLREENIIL